LIKCLKPRFSVTTDGGTSSNAVSFVGTNVHYLDEDLNMQFHTLGVRENKEKHTAENFRKKNDDLLDEFEIREKVVETVTDNEAKMCAAYNDTERVACLAHIFHKSVTKGCEEVTVVKKTVLKVRKISKKHNKSYALRYGVQSAQKKRNLKVRPLHQDVPTRWGSTRDSMESFLDEKIKKKRTDEEDNVVNPELDEEVEDFVEDFKNSEAINEALRNIKYKTKAKVNEFLLTRTDMLRMKNIHTLLTKLDVFSTTLGGAKFITTVIKSIIKLLSPDEDDPSYISEMKTIILNDFRARIKDLLSLPFLMKTAALDPRFKNLKTVDDKNMRNKVFQALEQEMRQHVLDLKSKEDENEKVDEPGLKKRKLGIDFDESDDEDDDQVDSLKREVDSYRSEPLLDKDCDPLEWWMKRKQKYPNLVRLVR
jgi:hypothetical protein